VPAAILDRQENIRDAWQGYVPDPYYSYYISGVPAEYNADMTYLRGTVIPLKEFFSEYVVDQDNGSESLGIIFHRVPVEGADTVTTSASVAVQTAQVMTTPFVTNPTFGRPEIIRFNALKVSQLENPKNGISVIQVTNGLIGGPIEYMRVIGLSSNVITAVRNYYPEYAQGTLPTTWPSGTKITPCVSTGYPEPSVYDPDWATTKNTVLRYYEVMGFARSLVAPFLIPQYAGERVLYNATLPLAPINGYANTAAPWPVEFNNPSTILANNHTWTFVGYFDYSRGLPKYQTNELSRKLAADYQTYGTWGGKITCFGAGESGALVVSGDFRESATLNYFQNNTPLQNFNDRVVYASPTPIDYPAPVLVYSVDDLTPQFTGVYNPSTGQVTGQTSFELKRGGYRIPASQLSNFGVLVFLGGVAQLPVTAYTINGSEIIFTEPPLVGTACDIRVITTDDQNKTLEVVPFAIGAPFNGSNVDFPLTPDLEGLTNGNSLVFLGGVLQDPLGPPTQTDFAYTVVNGTGGGLSISFIGAAPQKGTTIDVRGVLSGNIYRTAGVPIVFMSSTDEISDKFDGARTAFPLAIDGVSLDAFKVNSENMLVNLGGVMQIPIANAASSQLGLAYSVGVNPSSQVLEITFAVPPTFGTTCNIRVLSQDEFITCPLPELLINQNLKAGPGVETSIDGELIGLDEGLIGG
jgi:hypothetical protein